MHDDPLAGVGAVDAFGRPFCPVCGLDLRAGVCPACDPSRPTTPAARRARAESDRQRHELTAEQRRRELIITIVVGVLLIAFLVVAYVIGEAKIAPYRVQQ